MWVRDVELRVVEEPPIPETELASEIWTGG